MESSPQKMYEEIRTAMLLFFPDQLFTVYLKESAGGGILFKHTDEKDVSVLVDSGLYCNAKGEINICQKKIMLRLESRALKRSVLEFSDTPYYNFVKGSFSKKLAAVKELLCDFMRPCALCGSYLIPHHNFIRNGRILSYLSLNCPNCGKIEKIPRRKTIGHPFKSLIKMRRD